MESFLDFLILIISKLSLYQNLEYHRVKLNVQVKLKIILYKIREFDVVCL